MRLLQYDNNDNLSLTEFFDSAIPKYAILSHTWGAEEVTFEYLQKRSYRKKAGYKKIRFCGEQARRDGLQYFWVDTCCIDKSSSAELTEAINSMFRWYRDSTKCYVYLTDVDHVAKWEDSFQRSRWFTRGWTLQELIAPKEVNFFARDGTYLGNKSSIESILAEITGISTKVLRGHSLSECTVEERMSWAEARRTKREEDQIYSLLGIFDVSMPVIYGEGRAKAKRRLSFEIRKNSLSLGRSQHS
ncbi:heterokaryon incompatibility protein-domain-containing protein [Hyaloscypha finlandica]|nr:heterokaryon incompatibility protein-domain-containing protein [Hyaloscypha finlandica]